MPEMVVLIVDDKVSRRQIMRRAFLRGQIPTFVSFISIGCRGLFAQPTIPQNLSHPEGTLKNDFKS